MTIPGLLARFGAAYLLLLVVIAVALNLLGVNSSVGANTAALLGAVMWVCMAFGKKNGRYFTREEKTRAVLGMLVVDLAIQAVFSVGVGLFAGASVAQLGPVLLVLLFVGVLHALVIWFFVGFAGKQYAAAAAQQAKGG